MHRVLTPLALGLSVLSLTACSPKTPPRTETQPPPAPPIRVPPGCESSQAGEYYHAENPAFRYYGEDDGGTLSLAVVRARPEGGAEVPDAGAASIVLQRTPQGFVGETRATGFTGSGAPCPVVFPTEVVTCADTGLTLRSAASASIDEGCRPAPSGAPAVRLQQVLLRGSPDAGT
ncbi:hypothetical protein HPC49_34040 [Pyxidicoccus fallax]|uniref:Lipoprotein n=1 Tax=Pyxidicoccus fallax TaxID=394095 RepID=A0A848LS39_9BACT|nr:hypothetical protein [Pyxidicoccus fallax]NMO20755.1 hypothetical protein [Pyxidicoccus fallax]NPC83229.1 hypothetical protein [Pyxidicoccus fallax]